MNKTEQEQRNQELGSRLQMFRKEAEVTQKEMAEYCGITTNHLSKIEKGVYRCGAYVLIDYAKRLNLSLNTLVGMDANKDTEAIQTHQETKIQYQKEEENEDRLGERLKFYRQRGNVTQAEMADFCGLSKNHISAIERGLYSCTLKILMKYAMKLNLSLDTLAGLEVNEFTKEFTEEKPKILPELQKALTETSEKDQYKILQFLHLLQD